VNAGCERVALYSSGEAPGGPHMTLKTFSGNTDESDKDLRNWLINKACAAGADAVIDVVETQGFDENGPVRAIRGEAVVFPH
jgi:hypothetical protein